MTAEVLTASNDLSWSIKAIHSGLSYSADFSAVFFEDVCDGEFSIHYRFLFILMAVVNLMPHLFTLL